MAGPPVMTMRPIPEAPLSGLTTFFLQNGGSPTQHGVSRDWRNGEEITHHTT